MRLATSRRIECALNFSTLWIGGHAAESALCGNNHEHSAADRSLPEATEVVTRNLGARVVRVSLAVRGSPDSAPTPCVVRGSPDPAPAPDRRSQSTAARHRTSMRSETLRSDQCIGRETGHNRACRIAARDMTFQHAHALDHIQLRSGVTNERTRVQAHRGSPLR